MNILSSIRMQCNLMIHKKGFQFSFLISLLYCLGTYIYYALTYLHKDISTLFSAQSLFADYELTIFYPIFSSIYPFLLVFPFAFCFITDTQIKIKDVVKIRTGNSPYFVSQAITCMIGAFLIIFIPFVINIFLNSITFPADGNTFFGYINSINYNANLTGDSVVVKSNYKDLAFLRIYLKSPLLFNLLYSFINSLAAGISSLFIYSISFFIKRYKMLLLLPFYLLLYLFSNLDVILENTSPPYTQYNILRYLSIRISFGDSPVFILSFYIALLIISIIIIITKIKKESII